MVAEKNYPYDIALSYAGEDRDYASALAEALKAHGISVFYDRYEKATLWGKNLYNYLSDLYQNQAHYCIMLLSEHYAQKVWTTHEREAAQNRAIQENEEYILPIRLDMSELPGHMKTLVYLDWHEETIETITQIIIEKLGKATQQEIAPTFRNLSPPQTTISATAQKTKEEWLEDGTVLRDLKRYEEALAAFEQALRLDPNFTIAWHNKGNALDHLGKSREARQAYDRANQLGFKS
jgi:tetratricopeptide (TPR) repeat protein